MDKLLTYGAPPLPMGNLSLDKNRLLHQTDQGPTTNGEHHKYSTDAVSWHYALCHLDSGCLVLIFKCWPKEELFETGKNGSTASEGKADPEHPSSEHTFYACSSI